MHYSYEIFQDDEPKTALEDVQDVSLRGSYPVDHVHKATINLNISPHCIYCSQYKNGNKHVMKLLQHLKYLMM